MVGSIIYRKIINISFLALPLMSVAITLYFGTNHEYYHFHPYRNYQEGEFPFYHIFAICLIIIVESFVLWLIIRPSTFRYSWLRLLIGLLLFTPWLFLCIYTVGTGIPGFFIWHIIWVFFIESMIILHFLGILFLTIKKRYFQSLSKAL